MTDIKFGARQKSEMVAQLQEYMENELDIELGQFDAEFLLDYMIEKFGAAIYNQGVQDAQQVVESQFLGITDTLYQLEKVQDDKGH